MWGVLERGEREQFDGVGRVKKGLVDGGVAILDDAERSLPRLEDLHELELRKESATTRFIPGYTRYSLPSSDVVIRLFPIWQMLSKHYQ